MLGKIKKNAVAFWKEIAIVFLLTIALVAGLGLLSEPQTEDDLISPALFVLGAVLAVAPFFPAALGGFLVAKKSPRLRHALLVPALTVTLVSLLVVLAGFSMLAVMPEESWNAGYAEASAYLSAEISVEHFKLLTFLDPIPDAIRSVASYFGIGLAGAWVGAKFAGRRPGKKAGRQA